MNNAQLRPQRTFRQAAIRRSSAGRAATLIALFVVAGLATGGRASIAQPLIAGPEFRVNSGTVGDQSNPRVAIDAAGNFLVVWSGDGVAAQHFDRTGRRRGGELSIGSSASGVEVGMNGTGHFVAVSTDTSGGVLTAQMFTPTGATQGETLRLDAWNAYFGTAVKTATDGSFVVAWSDYVGWDYGPRFVVERFDRSGRSKGVLSHSGYGINPAIAMNAGGDFVLVWGGNRSLFGQRYDGAGRASGPSFQVNGTQTGFPADPAVALARDGSFFVTWRAWRQNGFVVDVVARRFDAAGAPRGDDFQVNARGGSPHEPGPDVAIAPDGSSLVVWSLEQDGDESGVFGQRFDARGQAVGTNFQINDFTRSVQSAPSVAFDSRGNAVVAWHSLEQDGSGYGIFARRYSPTGGSVDTDGDGVDDALDNCLTVPNADQADAGADDLGDACVAPDVVIHPTAQIGANPIIGAGTVIHEGVAIGDDAVIGEQVRLDRQARAGDRVGLGDRVTVGSRAVIGSDVKVGSDTRIELGASIGDAVVIGDGVAIARNVVVGPRAAIGPLVVLEIGARVGRGATVEMGARVGRRAIVRPGAVVPAGTTVAPGATFP